MSTIEPAIEGTHDEPTLEEHRGLVVLQAIIFGIFTLAIAGAVLTIVLTL
jgi:hypothetical protein